MIKFSVKAVLFASALLALSSCSMKNIDMTRAMSALSKGTQALTITNDEVAQYVAQSVEYMDAQNKVAPATNAYTQRLNKLTSGINSVGNIPLNFKVYITDDVNAFACADGSVRVYSGIMDMMTDDELLGIIGHEVGHVAKEHSKEAFKQQLVNSALLDAVASTSSAAAALTDGQLSQLASAFMSAKYSRSQENEADDYGYSFLKMHGKNPYCMVQAFEKMQKLEQNSGSTAAASSTLQNMFSSHPETAERIRRMTEKCVKDGYIK